MHSFAVEIPQKMTIHFSHQLFILPKWVVTKTKESGYPPWEQVFKPTYDKKIIFPTFFQARYGDVLYPLQGVYDLIDLVPTFLITLR